MSKDEAFELVLEMAKKTLRDHPMSIEQRRLCNTAVGIVTVIRLNQQGK